MIPRKNRLTSRDIRTSMSGSKKRYHGAYATLVVVPTSDDVARVACIASKKVAKTAVARNLLRRRGYAIFHELLDTLPPAVYLLYFTKPAVDASFSEIKEDITRVISKVQ